jgi:hypothetical protein
MLARRNEAAAAAPVNLEYYGGYLHWPGGETRAAVGAAGVSSTKKEGDKATPAGTFPLPFGMYRPDRIQLPDTSLPMTPLREAHAWVDDPNDQRYNQLIELPYPAHAEEMWRADGIYDLLVVVGYNINPTWPRRRQRDFPAHRPSEFFFDRGMHCHRARRAPEPDPVTGSAEHVDHPIVGRVQHSGTRHCAALAPRRVAPTQRLNRSREASRGAGRRCARAVS